MPAAVEIPAPVYITKTCPHYIQIFFQLKNENFIRKSLLFFSYFFLKIVGT